MVFEAKMDEMDGLKENTDRQKRMTDKRMSPMIEIEIAR